MCMYYLFRSLKLLFYCTILSCVNISLFILGSSEVTFNSHIENQNKDEIFYYF